LKVQKCIEKPKFRGYQLLFFGLVVGASAARPFSQIFIDPIVFWLEHLEHYQLASNINDLPAKKLGTLENRWNIT
jgi:hypothetical protein|tara:strand:+ start:832 stop:1056 length:225 start_codon:yes stop_codon:yes gene_type:complete